MAVLKSHGDKSCVKRFFSHAIEVKVEFGFCIYNIYLFKLGQVKQNFSSFEPCLTKGSPETIGLT